MPQGVFTLVGAVLLLRSGAVIRYRSTTADSETSGQRKLWRSNILVVVDAARIAYTEQRLRNGLVSVHPSVCPVDRQRQRSAAGLLLNTGAYSRYRSIAGTSVHGPTLRNAGSATLRAEAQQGLVSFSLVF